MARPVGTGAEQKAAQRGPLKTITIGQVNSVPSYGPWDFSNTSGGGSALIELHTVALKTSARATAGDEPRIAVKLPSLDDGTMQVLADGRLRVTWTLRQDVKWHDGTSFTADDLVFSWRLITRPDLRSSRRDHWMLAESVEATDPSTIVMTWPTTFSKALDMGADKLWPFPKHILAGSFEATSERDTFLAQPFFTTEYIGTGPFRITDWGFGENQVLEAFDQYFLGRPAVDRIVLRTIADVNTMLVNLQAHAVDVASEKTLPLSMLFRLRDEWSQTSGGTTYNRQENWRYIWFQFHPQYARPIELSQDARLRRGLLHGLDRDGLRDLLLPGIELTGADTFMPESDPRAAMVGRPFAHLTYDPRRALEEFENGGWRRAGDGRLVNTTSQQVQLQLRGGPPDEAELAFIAAGWRQLGIDMSELIPPPTLGRDNEFEATFPTMETRARSSGDAIFVSFDGRLHSGPENRWQGTNTSHYANPALDLRIDLIESTMDPRQQGFVLRELGEILAADLPAIPTYFRTVFVAVNRGIRALDDYPTGATGTLARNAHLWERD